MEVFLRGVLGNCFWRFLAWGSERCVKVFFTDRNERSKHRNHVAPNLNLRGGKMWPKMTSRWSLGASKWGQNTSTWGQNEPKMEPWGQQKRMWKMNPQKVVLHTLGGSLLGVMFDQKSMPKMKQHNNESKLEFWTHFGRFGWHFWNHFCEFFSLTA